MHKLTRIVILCFLTGLIFACGDNLSEKERLEKAIEFSSNGQYKAAIIELKNVLQQNPKNQEVRFELGKIYLTIGDLPAAEKELFKALQLGADRQKLMPYLARSLLYQEKSLEVLDLPHQEFGVEVQAEILAIKGLAQIKLGIIDEARLLIDEALQTYPKSISAMLGKVRIYLHDREFDKAREQLNALLKVDQQNGPAWSVLSNIKVFEEKYQEALEAINKAIKFVPYNKDYLFQRAVIYTQIKEYENAQNDISSLLENDKLNPRYNYIQGLIHLGNKKLGIAQAAFDLALVDEKNNPNVLFYASLTNLYLNQSERAKEYAHRFFSAAPGSIPARKILALVHLKHNEYDEAEKLVRTVVEKYPTDTDAMNILATALINKGKSNEAIDLLSRIVELDPESKNAQIRLGISHMISGDAAAGEEYISSAINLDKSNKRYEIVLILNYLNQKQFDKALAAAEAYVEKYNNEPSSYNILARVYMISGKKEKALEIYKQALEIAPNDPLINISLASFAMADKDYKKARSYYLDVLKQNNSHLGVLIQLSLVEYIEGNEKLMVEYLQRAIQAHPKAIQPKLSLARYYLSNGREDKISVLLQGLDKTQRKIPTVMEFTAIAKLAEKEYISAKHTLNKLVSVQPKSSVAHYLLAKAHAGLNKPREMKDELLKAIELAPDNLLPRIALAKLYLLARKLDVAKDQINAMKQIAPGNLDVLKLRASIELSEGNKNEALKLMQEVHEKSPRTPNLIAVSRIKWSMGDHEGTISMLNKWLEQYPKDNDVRLNLANHYAKMQDKDAAIEQYKIVLDSDDENLIALNNLAWNLRKSKPSEALEYAKYANKLTPGSPALMDTLAMVLLDNGDISRANTVIKEALIKAPKSTAIQYHAAVISAAAGEKDDAIRILDKLTAIKAKFKEKNDAKTLYEKLKGK